MPRRIRHTANAPTVKHGRLVVIPVLFYFSSTLAVSRPAPPRKVGASRKFVAELCTCRVSPVTLTTHAHD